MLRWTGLHIPNYQQFEDFDLDFTDPKTGEPLEKVCFIGANGTGKTTLLRMLFLDQPKRDMLAARYRMDGKDFLAHELINGQFGVYTRDPYHRNATSFDLSVFAKADANLGNLAAMHVPPSNLSMALALSPTKFPSRHQINAETVTEFWSLLIHHIKQRENNYTDFRRLPENRRRIVEDVDREFEENNPDILRPLAKLWSEILDTAGLVFDYEKAKLPVQLTDNLEAYVYLKNSDEYLHYNELSTGIRLFLFRLGHIFALFYKQSPASSLVLVDEPENSLFVDLQQKLVPLYQEAARGAQLFMATHSPLIAAQFRPEERIILEFDPDRPGKVIARRGMAPEGDDPNDVLKKDFGMEQVMSEAGVRAWNLYIEFRRKMLQSNNDIERDEATKEYHHLGRIYNFPA